MQVDLEKIITEGQIKLVLKTNTLLKLMRIFFSNVLLIFQMLLKFIISLL